MMGVGPYTIAHVNGKSLLVEREIIYIQEYEICHRQACWHIVGGAICFQYKIFAQAQITDRQYNKWLISIETIATINNGLITKCTRVNCLS